ncbi:MAG TPA: ATP-binding protein [Actinomycetota bacterium]
MRRGSEQTGTTPLDAFLGGATPAVGLSLGVLFVAGVGVVDHYTGTEVSLAPFYLMPVLLVTWNVGRAWGILVAGLATVASQMADVQQGAGYGLVPSWNAVVWFGVAVFVTVLLASVKESYREQGRELADRTVLSEDLREQNDLKNTLLHAVSHDLRGPLAGILGAMQTIRRGEQLGLTDEQRDELYGVVEQAGAKGARLVDDLLDLDRLERGTLTIERRPTDIGAIATRLTRELPTLQGRPVFVDAEPVTVDVDTARVERVIENLLNNAARHTPPGTPIHVVLRARRDGVDLSVEDEGPGVPKDIREEIFEPFRQGADARGGVGIGLSLVQRFAEIHGGAARVEDRPGGGARFVVHLPGEVTPVVAVETPTLHAV